MLKHPTLDQLHTLGLHGMAKAFAEITAGGEADGLGHHEWLGLLLDREASWRQDKRFAARLRVAKLRQQACVEDVDYRNPAVLTAPCSKSWQRANGSTPTTIWRSSAQPASARAGWPRRSATRRVATTARSSINACPGSSRPSPWGVATDADPRLLRNLGRADLLILDDWGLEPLDAAARHDLLEILEERYGRRSTMITSQLPVDRWHEIIGDPTYADAILDRLVHNAHRIELAGESMRRTRGKQNQKA